MLHLAAKHVSKGETDLSKNKKNKPRDRTDLEHEKKLDSFTATHSVRNRRSGRGTALERDRAIGTGRLQPLVSCTKLLKQIVEPF